MAMISVGQPMVAWSSGRVRPAGDRSPRRQGAGVRSGAAAVSPDKKPGEERAPSPPLRGALGAHASRDDLDEIVLLQAPSHRGLRALCFLAVALGTYDTLGDVHVTNHATQVQRGII
jgi:hypothetical protein